ncbi:MAG: hypothetical protein CMP39_02460 [Rickettsiales bacterium]|nr:hypothetical protein [Rickettsiales bacterium]
MPTITCYEQTENHLTNSAIWSTISALAEHVPDELIIITANNNYRESLIHLLINRDKLNYFPTIQSFDDWINQLLNIEPYSYFSCYHELLNLIESDFHHDHLLFLTQDEMIKTLLNFFLFLLLHDYDFDEQRHLFPDFLTKVEDDCRTLFKRFKNQTKTKLIFYNVMDKCRLIQERKTVLEQTLQNKTVVFLGFTHLTKTQRYLLQRLIPLTTQTAFYTSKESYVKDWVRQEFNDILEIPETNQRLNKSITRYSFDTLQQECRWVLKDCLNRLANNNDHTIQLVIPSDRHYNRTINELADEFNISLFSTKKQPFQQTSLFESLKSIINFIQYPDTVSALETLFSSPLISRFKHGHDLIDIDLELIIQVFRKESVVAGFYSMKQAFDFTLASLEKKISSDDDDDYSLRYKQRLEEQWLIIETLYTYTIGFKEQLVLKKWIDYFLHLIDLFDINNQLNFLADNGNVINQVAFDQFIQQLPKFITSVETGLKPYLNTICNRLILFLEQQTIDTEPTHTHSIYIHSLQEAVYFPASYSYVLGFHDSCWPYAIPENIFLKQINIPSFIDVYDDDKDYQYLLFSQLLTEECCLTSSIEYLGKQTEPSRFEFKLPFEINLTTAPSYSHQVSFTESLQRPIQYLDHKTINYDTISSKYSHLKSDSFNSLSNNVILADIKDKIRRKPFSATRLDTYQRCPSQYYFRYVLELEPAQELSEGISAAQWGVLVHEMMYLFNKNGQYNNKNNLKLAAEEAFSKVPYMNFYWEQKKELLFGTTTEPGLIDAIFETIQQQPYRLHPGQFEMDFNWTLPNSTYQFKGKIDALFFSDLNEPILIDYKTSRQLSSAVDFEEYRALQLPIYGLSIYKQTQRIPIGSLLFQINSQKHTDIKVIACTKNAKKDTFELKRKRPYIYDETYFNALEHHLATLIKLLESGFISTDYHPVLAKTYTKRSTICRVCPYSLHCHFKERFNAIY